jgi:nitroreductase/NAD-dependent dihydropyrimidine dehydrogenase PreA subunit
MFVTPGKEVDMLFHVDPEKCTRDGICTEDCRLIEMKEPDALPTPIIGAEELCIYCGHCVAVCPSGALTLKNMGPEACTELRKELVIDETQVQQFLRSRRSIRNYQDKPVDREKLNKLIQMAGYAPSAHNARPVHFLVIDDRKEVKRLSGLVADWFRLLLKNAPALVAPYHLDRVLEYWESGRDPICRNAPHLVVAHAVEGAQLAHVDCILALAYMELAAMPMGLGATWAGFVMLAASLYPPFQEALNLPNGHKCFGAMMIGYPTYRFARLPPRNPPPVTWRKSGETG